MKNSCCWLGHPFKICSNKSNTFIKQNKTMKITNQIWEDSTHFKPQDNHLKPTVFKISRHCRCTLAVVQSRDSKLVTAWNNYIVSAYPYCYSVRIYGNCWDLKYYRYKLNIILVENPPQYKWIGTLYMKDHFMTAEGLILQCWIPGTSYKENYLQL